MFEPVYCTEMIFNKKKEIKKYNYTVFSINIEVKQ